MKKYLLLSGALLSSTLLLTACQGIEGLFTDSPNRSSHPNSNYGNTQHTTTVYQSGASSRTSSAPRATTSSTANTSSNSSASSSSSSSTPESTTQAAKKTAGTAVPLEAPTVGQ